MVDVISDGDHAIKAQDNSAFALIGTDATIDFKNFSRMMPRQDSATPILPGLASDRDLLAQLTECNGSDHTPPDRPSVDHLGGAPDRRLREEIAQSDSSTQTQPMTEDQARQAVMDADKEFIWAQGEVQRIANGAKPSNPFVDLAYVLAGGTTYDTRVNLGDVAAQHGDTKGAIAAYEDALSNFMNGPLAITTGGDAKPEPPEDLIDKLKAVGVSKEQALKDIEEPKR